MTGAEVVNVDVHAYNITIRRAVFEGERLYEARVREFPDLHCYAETGAEAYELAIDAIETTASAFADERRRLPAPIAPVDDYSGRVTLRIARSLHRALAEEAESEGVSLNQYLADVLAYYTGFANGRRLGGEDRPRRPVATLSDAPDPPDNGHGVRHGSDGP